MNNDSTDLHEEPLGPQMLHLDEQLAQGLDEASTAVWSIPDEMQPRWERLKACVQLLRQALTPGADAEPTSGRPPDDHRVGATFGRFRILRELGRGGFGIVFLADDPELNRKVALKVPRPEALDNAGLRLRFLREARATAALDHPNLVAVYEAGQVGPVCYIASAFCPGISLAAWLQRHPPFAPVAAAELVAQLAAAVQHAHERGILHRDIKPSNILLVPADADLVPKLTDFGLAKLLNGDSELTASSTVLGTPQYMAPEQMGGANPTVGPAANVYSLGIVLFEMLTGQPPFRGSTALETLDLVRTQEPALPTLAQKKIPHDLSTICLKCLRKDPQRRYPTALELANDLERFLSGRPIQARPVGKPERAWRWSRRNPGWATVAVLIVLLAAGSVIAALRLGWALSISENAQHEAVRQLVRSRIDQARSLRLSRRVGQRHVALDLLLKARDEARQLAPSLIDEQELRTEVIACLALPDLKIQHEWPRVPPGTFSVGFDSTFSHCFRTDVEGALTVRRLADLRDVFQLPPTGTPRQASYSPDGRHLGAWDKGKSRFRVYRMSDTDAKVVLDVPAPGEPPLSEFANFCRDNRRLVALHADNSISVCDLVTGQTSCRLKPDVEVKELALHPTRAELAICTASGVRIYNLDTKEVVAVLHLPDAGFHLDWNPAGDLLAIGCDDQNIWLWNVGDSPADARPEATPPFSPSSPDASWRLRKLTGHKAFGVSVNFNGNGRLLASVDWTGAMNVWSVRDGRQLAMPLAAKGSFSWGDDPNLLAGCLAEGELRRYRVSEGNLFRQLLHHSTPDRSGWRVKMIFHPSGRWLVSGAEDGLAVWDAHSGEEIVQPSDADSHWRLPIGFDDAGALLTMSAEGLACWALQPDNGHHGAAALRVPQHCWGCPGLQQLLAVKGSKDTSSCSRDGQVVAIPRYDNGAELLHRGRRGQPEKRFFLKGQLDVRSCAVTPDGRWVATGTHTAGNENVVIWDAGAGKRVCALPIRGGAVVISSPDGRWLLTDGEECRLWKTETWQEHLTIQGHSAAFSSDGHLLAMGSGEGVVRLVDPDSGREYARLTAPGEFHSVPVCFSPDGSQLVVWGQETRSAHLWDLRGLREQLRQLDLDW